MLKQENFFDAIFGDSKISQKNYEVKKCYNNKIFLMLFLMIQKFPKKIMELKNVKTP